jgi:predicted glycoside hydrolase/deacetylase ChbG (UPF0249 family)
MTLDASRRETAIEAAAPLKTAAALRSIWLCADDYGISKSVNRAIRDLVMAGRLNATSVMVLAPSFDRSEGASLNVLNGGDKRVAIGLHVTLTTPFRPMSKGFHPTQSGTFLSLDQMFLRGALGLLDRQLLAFEIATQLEAFVTMFGRAPDFVDGHQHVHLFPQVRTVLLGVVRDAAPRAWVRQCGRVSFHAPWVDPKGAVLDFLSHRFRARARGYGVRTNPAFAGTYDFLKAGPADFARLFPSFLEGLPAGGVVMCHPGLVDDELVSLDPLTDLREHEYAYFANDGFPEVLRSHGVKLAAA